MPRTSKKKAAKRKGKSGKKSPARESKSLPQISLTKELSLQLFAASRYLGMDAERKLHLSIPMNVLLQDPQVLTENPDLAKDDEFFVRWEPGLFDGPTSARFAVVDRDSTSGKRHAPAQWDPSLRRFTAGNKPLDISHIDVPQFHQVNVWAMLQRALAFYEDGFGLGRSIPWGFEGNRLTVAPHAGEGKNAFYDRKSKSLQFFYFDQENERIYTCLSADIVYHELAHAILDGVRPYYLEGGSVQTGAFHEFMGDISAILLSLRNKRFRGVVAKQTKGDLSAAKNVSSIAEQFGNKTKARPYLRTARSRARMSHVEGLTSVHTVSQVLTAAVFKILLELTRQYLEREKQRFESGASRRKPSAKRVFWNAIQRMQRVVIQPLDLLPPVDVTFRDYALAVLRAEQLANPLDPHGYFGLMLDVFVQREILDENDRSELTANRYLYQRERLGVFHDIDELSRSRAAAYRFLHDNREELYIPLGADLVVADLYDANKLHRAGMRLPRQIVLEYIWREDVELEHERFGIYQGKVTTLLCGGTIVFDDKGNVLSWMRKPGTTMQADEARQGWRDRKDTKIGKAWYAELAEARQRREAMLDSLAARIAAGEIGAAFDNRKGMAGNEAIRPLSAEVDSGVVQFKLSPHLTIGGDDSG